MHSASQSVEPGWALMIHLSMNVILVCQVSLDYSRLWSTVDLSPHQHVCELLGSEVQSHHSRFKFLKFVKALEETDGRRLSSTRTKVSVWNQRTLPVPADECADGTSTRMAHRNCDVEVHFERAEDDANRCGQEHGSNRPGNEAKANSYCRRSPASASTIFTTIISLSSDDPGGSERTSSAGSGSGSGSGSRRLFSSAVEAV